MKTYSFPYLRGLLIAILGLSTLYTFAQTEPCDCSDGTPTTEGDLLAGGSFCGDATIAVGADFSPVNEICWSSGTLTLTGTNADVFISGIFQVAGGTVDLDNNTQQQLDVSSGGNLIVGDGATLFSNNRIAIQSGGNMTVQGTVTSNTGDIDIFGTVTVDGNGLLTGAGDDIKVDGGYLSVLGANGTATALDDFSAYNGGTIYVSQNGTINSTNNLVTSTNSNGSVDSDGIIIIDGTANVGGVVVITPSGTGSGSGVINVGTLTDNSGDNNFSCTGGVCTGSNAPLPVELTDFSYEVNNNNVTLNWSTASELNNQGFNVEKSSNGESFNVTGFIEGNGTTNEMNTYSFVDQGPNTGAYYRLQQVDFDGAYEYSNMLFVPLSNAVRSSIVVFPNPTTDSIRIQTPLTNYRLSNLSGQVIISNGSTTSSLAEIEINNVLFKTRSGIYFLKTEMEGKVSIAKIIKQ